ncbi:MAG TPA: Gfo/Idh/MocA family oxidoreductase [Polyangiaceae bacterium]|jgi:UDP-2-acetamido-3-amino-2,3-dideoxy-glucuronate N-acetyltransferase|nr:Gfo/Idh/MocA family oxidoreductase [Polyangiaceae bacterium]
MSRVPGEISTERRLGVAVVGAGRWGKNLVRVFDSVERARLVSVCDVARARLASLPANVDKTSDVTRLLVDPRVEAVVIATPCDTHADVAVMSLEAGKHVFVEKPLALSVADARRVLRAAHVADRRVMVGFVLHYHPAIEKLRHWIGNGVLGQVRAVLSVRSGPRGAAHEPGPWWSLAPHDVSTVRFLLGREPHSVTVHPQCAGSARLNARLAFDGLIAELSVGHESDGKVRRLVVVGTHGSALFDDTHTERKLRLFDMTGDAARRLVRPERELPALFPKVAPKLPAREPLRLEAAHFVEALLGGVPFRTDAAEGARVVEILEAGQESLAALGLPVSVASGTQKTPFGAREREDEGLPRSTRDAELAGATG